jgi:hydroxymethylpyrimidine pyrophosphatase-like HAD family hydrolase
VPNATSPDIRLVAVDLDGTLLDPHDRVTARTREAIARARASGLRVIPATGRPDRLVWDVAAEAGLGPLGVCSNGAVLIDLEAGTILSRNGFTGPEAEVIVDILRRVAPGVALGIDEGDLFVHEHGLFDGLDLPARSGRLAVDDLRRRVRGGCLKFVARRADLTSVDLAAIVSPALRGGAASLGGPVLAGGADLLAGAALPSGPAPRGGTAPVAGPALASGPAPVGRAVLPGGAALVGGPVPTADRHAAERAGMDHVGPADLAEVTASDIAWVDIGPAGLSKATGLADVCRRLGLDLSEVAAIGDHYNDLPMLRAVGLAGAMGNAVPEALDAATVIMPTNAEDGVAAFLDLIVDGPPTMSRPAPG